MTKKIIYAVLALLVMAGCTAGDRSSSWEEGIPQGPAGGNAGILTGRWKETPKGSVFVIKADLGFGAQVVVRNENGGFSRMLVYGYLELESGDIYTMEGMSGAAASFNQRKVTITIDSSPPAKITIAGANGDDRMDPQNQNSPKVDPIINNYFGGTYTKQN